jgi:hypothetical protein
MVKAGMPERDLHLDIDGSDSVPSNATVQTRWTVSGPRPRE